MACREGRNINNLIAWELPNRVLHPTKASNAASSRWVMKQVQQFAVR